MSPSLCKVNDDVLNLILDNLEIDDILKLERVNSRLHRAIRDSKSTWLRLLRQCMALYDLQLPYSDNNASDMSATMLRMYLQSAFSVRKNLRKGLPVSVFNFPSQLPITWIRIIRSRWILVASCDEHHSFMTCWDSTPSRDPSSPEQLFQHSLEGPVVDGEVNDGPSGIVIAVTVETWPTKICVLGVQVEQETSASSLRPLLEITGGSNVAAVSGDWLAYRVQDGAEEAQLVQWTTGGRHHLDSTTFVGDFHCHRPEFRGPAMAIAIWAGYAIVVFRREVHIFDVSDSPTLLQTAEIPGIGRRECAAASFVTETGDTPLTSMMDFHPPDHRLLLFTRDTGYSAFSEGFTITSFSLSMEARSRQVLNVKSGQTVIISSLGFDDIMIGACLAHEMTLSTTGLMLAWVNGNLLEYPKLVFLHFQRRKPFETSQENHQDSIILAHTADLSQLPCLVPRSSFALDDRRGLLVVGTIDGKLAMVRFHDRGSWNGLRGSIPSLQIASDNMQTRDIGPIKVLPRWPYVKCKDNGEAAIDLNVFDIFSSDWGHGSGIALPEEWTTDWDNLRQPAAWFPCSRWLAHRADVYASGVSSRLREEYGVIGTPIPICWGGIREGFYRKSVLFRIGRRPYFTCSHEFMIPFGTDDRALSIEEVLVDPTAAYCRSVHVTNNVMHPMEEGQADPIWFQRARSETLLTASNYVSSHPEMKLARSSDPSTWSPEEWENVSETELLRSVRF